MAASVVVFVEELLVVLEMLPRLCLRLEELEVEDWLCRLSIGGLGRCLIDIALSLFIVEMVDGEEEEEEGEEEEEE